MCLISKKKADRQTAEAVERVRNSNRNELFARDNMIEKRDKLLLDKQSEIDTLTKANAKLKHELHEVKHELNDRIGVVMDQNAVISKLNETVETLRSVAERPSCDGCTKSYNYRRCASCSRYPKLKDKYEADGEPDAG